MAGTGYMKSDPGWWEKMDRDIKSICGKYGVSCTPERDEWKYELSRRYGKLF
jgi:hypothetical protein